MGETLCCLFIYLFIPKSHYFLLYIAPFPQLKDRKTQTKQPVRFQRLLRVTNEIARKWKAKKALEWILQLFSQKVALPFHWKWKWMRLVQFWELKKHHSCPYTTKCTRFHTIFFTNRTPLSSITISYQFDWIWGNLIYVEPPSLSAKENAQKVEFVVLFKIKWKLFIQLRSGSLCSKRSNRWEEDLFVANQVSDMAAKQDEIRRNAREIF